MITIMSILIAIIMFVTGMGRLGAPLIIAAGLIADLIAKKGGYKSFKMTAISHGVFCLWICANYFPVIVTAKDYRKSLLDGGYSAEYCDALFRAINRSRDAVLSDDQRGISQHQRCDENAGHFLCRRKDHKNDRIPPCSADVLLPEYR